MRVYARKRDQNKMLPPPGKNPAGAHEYTLRVIHTHSSTLVVQIVTYSTHHIGLVLYTLQMD